MNASSSRSSGLTQLPKLAFDIQVDLQIFQRDYSSLRRGNSKWMRSNRMQGEVGVVTVQRRPGLTEHCVLRDLYYRAALKRHPVLFRLVLQVWKRLNPFHIKLLSKPVLQAFNEYLLESVFTPVPDASQIRGLAARDTEVDLRGKDGLTFSDFYDSLFEAVDNWTRSKLLMEYALITRKIAEGLDRAMWLNNLELHNKAHISNSPSKQYAHWMFPLIVQSKSRHLFLSAPNSPKINYHEVHAPHLSQTAIPRPKPTKDVFLTQMKNLATKPRRELERSLGDLRKSRVASMSQSVLRLD